MITDEKVGKNIRLLRVAKRLSQEELGQEANISAAMISYIEKGIRPLPLKTGYLIAKALNCTVDDLIEKDYQIAGEK